MVTSYSFYGISKTIFTVFSVHFFLNLQTSSFVGTFLPALPVLSVQFYEINTITIISAQFFLNLLTTSFI